MRKEGREILLPDIEHPWILEQLMEIGLFEVSGMDRVPLSWREINEWQRATGVPLQPWQARLMRRLSADYLAELRRAENLHCPPPWSAGPTAADRAADENALRDLLG